MIKQLSYTGAGLNRLAERREDSEWLDAMAAHPDTRYWPMCRGAPLVGSSDGKVVCLDAARFEPLTAWCEQTAFLGLDADGHAEFAAGLAPEVLVAPEGPLAGLRCADLRELGRVLPRQSSARLAYARALLGWHADSRHCPRCGAVTRAVQGGHRRRCSDGECDHLQFPRTDPAVIMLIENGEHCLLGRQAHWPAGMHSVLAGFVEPGENLEEAVAREVWEETGIEICDIRYRASQPWPFPASIMLGFRAHALTAKIRAVDSELEAARWYHRDELLRSPESDHFRLPRPDSLARKLLDEWLREPAGGGRGRAARRP